MRDCGKARFVFGRLLADVVQQCDGFTQRGQCFRRFLSFQNLRLRPISTPAFAGFGLFQQFQSAFDYFQCLFVLACGQQSATARPATTTSGPAQRQRRDFIGGVLGGVFF